MHSFYSLLLIDLLGYLGPMPPTS